MPGSRLGPWPEVAPQGTLIEPASGSGQFGPTGHGHLYHNHQLPGLILGGEQTYIGVSWAPDAHPDMGPLF